MDNLEAVLMRLAQAPVPAGLDMIEAGVFARIAARPAASASIRVGVMTIAAALVMGIVGARIPAGQTGLVSPLSPLAAVSPLAPSTLLVSAP